MKPEEFRRIGHEVVDWIADYRARVEEFPVRSQVEPGWVRGQLSALPERGEGFGPLLADLDRVVLPGTTHWQHPGFFAYFPSNASLPSVLGDLLSSGLGVQGMLWATSPAATEVEQHLMDELVTAMDLPRSFLGGGVIQDTASSAALVAVLAALHRSSGGTWRRSGVDGAETVYVSSQTHSSLERAARLAGLGEQAVRSVPVSPSTLAMDAAALAERVRADVAAGRRPVLVCATVGTTGTGAVDPLREIADVCAEHGIWLHVDAAWAGPAALCPEFRDLFDGLERADSFTANAHKWMLTAFDLSLFWTAHPGVLVDALAILPEYLRNTATESGAVVDYRDWQIPLGRRFRALKLWSVLRWYGLEGVRAHLRGHVELAALLESWVGASEDWELVAPRTLSLVTIARRDGDDATRAAMDRVNGSGRAFVTHTVVGGRFAIRVAIGAEATREEHVRALWEALDA
ncbi:pyridoxal phosphate-dependent decarboxylase family protein [Saccharothrix longispora]|uniref:pyridoxal phosphate-dependent decarboxylase family protein n=1 Tax=Saccharothrix longispora TaxID=33920 RepID=UPI0028FD885A|nr:aminotransferase class I/II-fold pyridoxal phosphate-dependent enzyme [Saccharothrix longispora]MBY8847426.1 aminotransferase class I/II-fold pyridoxal phosphate-dependent enzyme [Saccharothrix sp. MB29]MDU0290102.1 aminotransferase class I/II-fold pyridoxal phosphate-dependent enzyme [Saccharothrix longispora]